MIGVVHLVWGPLGAGPFMRFLESYRVQPAGADHELVVVWNGTDAAQRAQLQRLTDGVACRFLTVERPVQDLAAYRIAAQELPHDRLCFLNSHTVIAAPGWLGKLDGALSGDRPAIAGASGSWMSIRSAYLEILGLPTPYRGSLPPRRTVVAEMRRMNAELRAEGGAVAPAPLRDRLELAARRALHSRAFPAPHIRTNGFLIDRRLVQALLARAPEDKLDAYRLEAGSDGLTASVLAAGGRARVVDSTGRAYDVGEWSASGTFWQAGQERLLLEDNQTRVYARGGPDRRAVLAGWAWGGLAGPRLSGGPA